jgi:predicted nucleic acid-binding protein
MMYILDTDVLSELARNSGHGALKAWVRDQPNHSLMITFSVFLEIHRGIERLRESNPPKACQLEEWFERLVASDQFVIADMNVRSAKIYAKMTLMPALRFLWTTTPGSKYPKQGQDLAIAAMAIFHDVPVVTRNHKDFLIIHNHFPLPGLYNPATDTWHIPVTDSSEIPVLQQI